MEEEDFFSFDIIESDGEILLKIYKDDYGAFQTYGKSTRIKPQVGSQWAGPPTFIDQDRFLPNARYSLEEVDHNTFKFVFDSVIVSKSETYQMGIPGVMFYSMR